MDIIRYFCSGLWSSVILLGIGIGGITALKSNVVFDAV